MPIIDKATLEVCKVLTGADLSTVFLNGSPKTETPSSGIKESRSVCSVLNIIRECQSLFIIVELRCEHLRNACTNFCCATKTHQRKTTTATTARANILLVVFGARCSDRIRDHHIDHFRTTVYALICTFFAKFHLQTVGTNLCGNHTRNTFVVGMREHHHDFFICTEVHIIERFQIRHSSITALIKNGYPTGNTTVTTVYNRKVLLGLLFIQIMGNLIGDFFRINLGNQTAKLTHPKLYLNIKEWAQFSYLTSSCMRDQCE